MATACSWSLPAERTLVVAIGRRFGLRAEWLPRVVRWWYAHLCRALGVQVQVTGEFVPNALLVANHVSWLDIPVLGSQARIDFLSKADIKAWPLIGWMAQIIGTLFIVRGANQTDVLIPEIGERVQRGRHLVIFPAGTILPMVPGCTAFIRGCSLPASSPGCWFSQSPCATASTPPRTRSPLSSAMMLCCPTWCG